MSGFVYSSILQNDSFLACELRKLILRSQSFFLLMGADFLAIGEGPLLLSKAEIE